MLAVSTTAANVVQNCQPRSSYKLSTDVACCLALIRFILRYCSSPSLTGSAVALAWECTCPHFAMPLTMCSPPQSTRRPLPALPQVPTPVPALANAESFILKSREIRIYGPCCALPSRESSNPERHQGAAVANYRPCEPISCSRHSLPDPSPEPAESPVCLYA